MAEQTVSLHLDLESVLLTREQIAWRVAELGDQISRDYRGRDLVLVGVLKGSVVFLADLMRAITIPHRFELVRASSYGSGTTSSGRVAVSRRSDLPLEGRDVLIVEDVIDTGQTLAALGREFDGLGARSVALCVFLSKRRERAVEIRPQYVGFEIPDHYVVGYGLDYDDRYRHLDCVGVLKQAVYENPARADSAEIPNRAAGA
jgi:hypoxanthine phosphoribosyltransferase